MTLPIIPGPFSFLGEAGQAAGAIGQALQERDMRRRQIAQQNAAFLATLISAGVASPETLAGADTQKLFQAAGIPPIQPGQVEIPAKTAQGRRYNKELAAIPEGTTQSQLAAGVPTAAAAKVNEAQGATADATLGALAGLNKEQLLQMHGILTPEAATMANKLYLEKAQTELQQQDPARSEAAARNDIWQSVRKRLPKDQVFNTIADYAAIGGLSYLNTQLEASARMAEGSRALNTEKIRLVTSVTSQAAQEFKAARAAWEAGLKQARAAAFNPGEIADMSPKDYSKRLNAIDSDYVQRNPMPQFDDFLNQHLEAGGLSQNDFQDAFRSLTHTGAGPAQSNYDKVKAAARSGQITEADVDAATTLSAQQKAEIKALIPKRK